MKETLGKIIDTLFTIDIKMWNEQELLYKIWKMSFEEYKNTYMFSSDGPKRLWDCLQKTCDLNVERNELIDKVDEKIIELFKKNKNER